jgi:hypothetical protein
MIETIFVIILFVIYLRQRDQISHEQGIFWR